jgi:hypothetical protein
VHSAGYGRPYCRGNGARLRCATQPVVSR